MLLHGYDASDGSFTGTSKFSNPVMEAAQKGNSLVVADFEFPEDVDLYTSDGVTFTLIDGWEAIRDERNKPAPELPPDYGSKISRLAFKLRMTTDERKAIRAAAESNADLYDFMDLLSDSTYIDLARAETTAGVGQLEAAGLLAPGRGDEVLNTPVTKEEQWNVARSLS